MAPFTPVTGLIAFAVNLLIGGAALHLGINVLDGGSPVLIAPLRAIAAAIEYLLTIVGGYTWVKAHVLSERRADLDRRECHIPNSPASIEPDGGYRGA